MAKKKVTFLLSGESEIVTLVGDRVSRWNHTIAGDALSVRFADHFEENKKYIVIAHGGRDVIHLLRPSHGPSFHWLSPQTTELPTGAEILFLVCFSGLHVNAKLSQNRVLGHRGPVPLPTPLYQSQVWTYYTKARNALASSSDPQSWHAELSTLIDRELFRARALQDALGLYVWEEIRFALHGAAP